LKALILAGGFGTRLRPMSCTRPKSLFPVINKPLLQWTFERLAVSNVSEAVLAVNYQTEAAIKQHRVLKYGVHAMYSRDPLGKPLGTGGAIKKAEKHIGRDAPFIALNGDIFADVDYAQILKLNERKKAVATIALHRVEDPARYGVALLDENDHIVRFVEKPTRESAPSNLINAGAYVLSPEIFDYIPKARAVSMEREVFPKLAEENRLCGYVYEGVWIDIGKPEDYLEANRLMLDRLNDEPRSRIDKHAKIRIPVAIDNGVSIGEGSIVGPYTVLGRNVKLGENVRVQESVVLANTVISDHCSVEGAVIGDGAFIGKEVEIRKGCLIGDHARLGDNVKLAEGATVCPASQISQRVMAAQTTV
jgi:mannose-1-phosphate guanylyltransferase